MVDPHVEPVAFAEGSKAEVIVEVHPPNRRMRTRMYGGVALADRELSRSEHCFAERLLCSAWASAAGRTLLAISAEPPYADPHVRWCGRGEWATTSPMPIFNRSEHLVVVLFQVEEDSVLLVADH